MAEDALSATSALAAHPLFRTWSPVELDRIGRVATVLVVDTGYVLTREGRRGYELFLVLEGTATSSAEGVAAATLGPGDHFGASGPDGSATAGSTIVAATPMRLVAVDARELNAVRAIRPGTVGAQLAGAEG